MRKWALLRDGRIINVVTTSCSRDEVAARHPTYEVADLYSLPPHVQQAYQYWSERP